jgi:hypothetical protein
MLAYERSMKVAWLPRGFCVAFCVLGASVSCAEEPDTIIIVTDAGGAGNNSPGGAGGSSGGGAGSSGSMSGGGSPNAGGSANVSGNGGSVGGSEASGGSASGQGNSGSGGATGGTTGGSSGSSGSGGAGGSGPGKCVGLATACADIQDEPSCTQQYSCSYSESCMGNGADCDDYLYQAETPCESLPGCTWDGLNGQCTGNNIPECWEGKPTEAACVDWPGCSWSRLCSGAATQCSTILLEQPCSNQLGCTWQLD